MMMATVHERGTITMAQLPPTTAVAMGGAMPKDEGSGTLLQSGRDGDGTAECLVAPPPGPLLADIIRGRRDAAWKCCHLSAMSLSMMMTVKKMTGSSK